MASINNVPMPGLNKDDDSDEEPSTKKLRSVEWDLKIIVGDVPTNDGGQGQCEYWYHSAVMATHSRFIDTLLASPMKESISREIRLPDVEPKTWDLAMKFLLRPRESRKMTMEDAVEIFPLYDKYEFREGLKLCNDVIYEGFEEARKNKKNTDPEMLNLYVRAFVLCDSCNLLEYAMHQAFYYFLVVVRDQSLRMIFNEEQLREVIPSYLKAWEKWVGGSLDECLVCHGWSAEHMASPMFARLILTEWELISCSNELVATTPSINVSGLPERFSEFMGTYHVQHRREDDGQSCMLYFDLNPTTDGDTSANEASASTMIVVRARAYHSSVGLAGWCWCLCEAVHSHHMPPRVINVLWYVPHSTERPLPPVRGWIPTNSEDRKGTSPRISHQYQC